VSISILTKPARLIYGLYHLLCVKPSIALVIFLSKLIKIHDPIVKLYNKILTKSDGWLDVLFVAIGKSIKFLTEKNDVVCIIKLLCSINKELSI